jgi:hypothetical protein
VRPAAFSSIRSMPAANDAGSPGGSTSSPSRPCSTSSSKPEILLATIGTPQLSPSSSTTPKLAFRQGEQRTSAEA